MKTIGLLGGMSWESTLFYYKWINEGVRERLGGLHSARIVMNSVEFAEIEHYQVTGQWEKAGDVLAGHAEGLQKAGADMILICTNLMHKVAPAIEARVDLPLLHIADATGREIARQGRKKVGLLGAIYTMEEDFYSKRLKDNFDIDVVIPERKDREFVQQVIFGELCRGEFKDESRAEYLRIIEDLRGQGAEGVILGCTEIPLLISPEDTDLPLYNTTALHAAYALEQAFEENVALAV